MTGDREIMSEEGVRSGLESVQVHENFRHLKMK